MSARIGSALSAAFMLIGLCAIAASTQSAGGSVRGGEAWALTGGDCPADTITKLLCFQGTEEPNCGNFKGPCITQCDFGNQGLAETCTDDDHCNEPQSITQCANSGR